MSKTYKVTTYQDAATYTVTLDDTGVVSATELSEKAVEDLKNSVTRLMTRYGLTPVVALSRVVGSYSTVTDAEDVPVADSPAEDIVT